MAWRCAWIPNTAFSRRRKVPGRNTQVLATFCDNHRRRRTRMRNHYLALAAGKDSSAKGYCSQKHSRWFDPISHIHPCFRRMLKPESKGRVAPNHLMAWEGRRVCLQRLLGNRRQRSRKRFAEPESVLSLISAPRSACQNPSCNVHLSPLIPQFSPAKNPDASRALTQSRVVGTHS